MARFVLVQMRSDVGVAFAKERPALARLNQISKPGRNQHHAIRSSMIQLRLIASLVVLVACFMAVAVACSGSDMRTVGLAGLCASAALFIVGICYLFNSGEAASAIAADDDR